MRFIKLTKISGHTKTEFAINSEFIVRIYPREETPFTFVELYGAQESRVCVVETMQDILHKIQPPTVSFNRR